MIRITGRKRRRRQSAMPERRTKDDPAPTDPVVLILGTGQRARKVRELMRRLGMAYRLASEPAIALDKLEPAIRLVVIVPPLADLSAEGLCRRMRTRGDRRGIPILVVGAPRGQTGRLYEAGASGLFEWPTEQAAFVRALLRLTGAGTDRVDGSARDASLAARVEERLKAERDAFGPLVTSRVRRGVVILGGEVDAIWKISELERTITEMPGVDEVVTQDVQIPVTGVPDRQISQSIRTMLRCTAGLEHRTFGIRAANGRVIVTGTAQSRREMDRVIRLIEQVRGVRGIENLLVVSSRAKHRDRTLAMMLSRLVAGQFPAASVDLSVFGKIVVLYGKANDSTERRAIERLAGNTPGVERVVSKVG